MNLSTWVAQDMYWGWFRPYWLFIFCGFLITILISWFRFKKRHIPTQGLYIAIFLLTPFALIGASIFGKLDIIHPVQFYQLFMFWLPGMSIHGGLLFGLIAGWGWFGYEARKNNISIWVYADLIIPNILIAQALGRWGNFFNHELLGAPVDRSALMWLPSFIRDNLFKWYIDPNGIIDPQTNVITAGGHIPFDPTNPDFWNKIQYFQPIFLYESFANVMLWAVIVFLVPAIFRYSYYWQFKKREPDFATLSYKGVWDKWYYDVHPDQQTVRNLSQQENLKKIYFKNIYKVPRWERFKIRLKYLGARIKQTFRSNREKLEKIQNPHNLIILRSGVQAGLYIFGYNIIRLILELQRTDQDLFIKNARVLDYVIISLMILIGAVLVLFAQFISVKKWRKGGWLYEKQY
ncbi:prolipoprotein diacylglyceryl transferase [Spiroplasma syrphidicola EA-1]|uniref:Prolipoprotein diacylglyceryl transferase n=1 Tax=Spiroplasma syrphidicola EA-1 TaxID=1276229 RepID=R4UCX4_9MOLU|nr:prolipoprotein diacylglyceryl transferase family protein [Spiroplasma syrphidicola]AGM25739.1 prolipoprotein diacylglyceryl transferase [Spiroplasma syrphidicola EA-1]